MNSPDIQDEFKKKRKGHVLRVEEMTQQLRAPNALARGPSTIPSTYMIVHNHPLLQDQGIQNALLAFLSI